MVVVVGVLVLVQEEKGPSQARSYPIGESPHAIFRAAGKRFEKPFITPDAENNSSADSYPPSVWIMCRASYLQLMEISVRAGR